MDIEFVSQQALLSLGREGADPPPSETASLLGWLATTGALAPGRAQALADAHARLLDRGLRCALALEKRLVPVGLGRELAASAMA